MPVITLTTEWQGHDYFHGIIKGKLATQCPGIPIIDNACAIPPFNIQHAAFVVRNTFRHYPEGSIHIICVNSEYHKDQPLLAVKSQGHYFISSDNGIFYLILNSEPDEIVLLEESDKANPTGELDLFARAAAAISKGGSLQDIGSKTERFSERVPLRATIEENAITGSIIFIDSYGNAVSNITKELFARVIATRSFQLTIRSNKNLISKISESYKSEPVSDLVALFNTLNLLEVGLNGNDAASLLSLTIGDVIRVAHLDGKKAPGQLF